MDLKNDAVTATLPCVPQWARMAVVPSRIGDYELPPAAFCSDSLPFVARFVGFIGIQCLWYVGYHSVLLNLSFTNLTVTDDPSIARAVVLVNRH